MICVMFRATQVPVGEDQLPHIQFTHYLVRKFNSTYGDTFVEPKPILYGNCYEIVNYGAIMKVNKIKQYFVKKKFQEIWDPKLKAYGILPKRCQNQTIVKEVELK